MTMSKRKSKDGSKNGKLKKNRAKSDSSNLVKQQENFAETILESNEEQNENISESTSETSDTNTTNESTSETSFNNTNECYEEIKAKQQELLNKLKNLSDSIGFITLTRDNTDSLRIELLSNIYFTRQVRPLADAVNLIAFASSNMSNIAQNININTFGDKKEIKNAFKLCYTRIIKDFS